MLVFPNGDALDHHDPPHPSVGVNRHGGQPHIPLPQQSVVAFKT